LSLVVIRISFKPLSDVQQRLALIGVSYFRAIMAKRMTDSNKWEDAWFSDLPSKYKLLYLYLLDTCDHAGIWKVNFKVAMFMIGENLEPSEVKRVLSGRIRVINDEYWLIEKFIKFQYGNIKSDTVGKSVTKILESFSLQDVILQNTSANFKGASKGLDSPYQGSKDKDKDKAKVKDKVKDKVKEEERSENFEKIDDSNLRPPTIEQCRQVAMMSGHDPAYGESYFYLRDADGWCKPRGKGEYMQMIPIANWRSDYANVKNQGYLKLMDDGEKF
jgi:hypothetical protein